MKYRDLSDASYIGAFHGYVMREMSNKYPEIKGKHFQFLLLCNVFYSRGGFFCVPDLLRVTGRWTRHGTSRTYLKWLIHKGYVAYAHTGKRQRKYYSLTTMGEMACRYYALCLNRMNQRSSNHRFTKSFIHGASPD